MPKNRLLWRTFNAHDFFSLVAGKQRRSASKTPFCYYNTLTRARPAPSRPTLCFPFPPLLCAHSCLSVSSNKTNKYVLAGFRKGRFFYYYIYISSFKLLLEVRLDLPKQVCSVRPQRLPSVSPPRLAGQPAQEARRSEVPLGGDRCHSDAAEPLISMTWLTSPIPRVAVPLRHRPPRQEHRPVRPPGPSSSVSSPPAFPRVWLSLCPPLSLLSRTIWKSTKGPLPRIGLL